MTREEKLTEEYIRLTDRERSVRAKGYEIICGADEAGRGPLCGPVVAAAVILPEGCRILGVRDSKKVPEKKREELFADITSSALSFCVGIVGPEDVDGMNILNAARLAFKKAIEGLKIKPDYIFTDAISGLDIDMEYESVIKGDANIYSIAAASIIAKVTRDRIMREYDEMYPEYGFARHKGYGTREHYDAILRYGALPIHRRSFLKKLPDSIYRHL